MQKEDDIVTFETYYSPMLAEILRTKLEANGIPCFIADENLGIMLPLYNQGGAGIKIKVFARDLEKAQQVAADETDLPGDEDFESQQ